MKPSYYISRMGLLMAEEEVPGITEEVDEDKWADWGGRWMVGDMMTDGAV